MTSFTNFSGEYIAYDTHKKYGLLFFVKEFNFQSRYNRFRDYPLTNSKTLTSL